MQIFVKDPAGKTVTIDDVVPSDTIATVLDQFERKTQMRARTNMRYAYAYGGRPLDIDKPLDHYGIGRTDTIHCYLAPVSSCDTRLGGVQTHREASSEHGAEEILHQLPPAAEPPPAADPPPPAPPAATAPTSTAALKKKAMELAKAGDKQGALAALEEAEQLRLEQLRRDANAGRQLEAQLEALRKGS